MELKYLHVIVQIIFSQLRSVHKMCHCNKCHHNINSTAREFIMKIDWLLSCEYDHFLRQFATLSLVFKLAIKRSMGKLSRLITLHFWI